NMLEFTMLSMIFGGGIHMKRTVTDLVVIIFGSLLFALAVNLFVIPTDLGEGGVTGITIILYYLYGWSPGLVNFILNGLLLIVGYTIIVVILISLFLHLTRNLMIDSNEVIVNMVFAGLLAGSGIGLIIRVGGTTAGTTILASITKKYLGWNVSYGLLFFDLI